MEGYERMIRLVSPLKPNQCRVCGAMMKLVEVERCSYVLNEYGEKVDFLSDEFYEAHLQCTRCGSIMDVEKRGLRYYPKKVLPEIKFEITNYNPFQIPISERK